MTALDASPSSVFTFGKHSGKTFAFVAHVQSSYADFLLNTIRYQLLTPKDPSKPPVTSKLFADEVVPFVMYCATLHIYDHLVSSELVEVIRSNDFEVEETVEGEQKVLRNRFRTFSNTNVEEPPIKRPYAKSTIQL